MDNKDDKRRRQANRSAAGSTKHPAQAGLPSELSRLFPYVGFSLLFVWAAYLLRPLDSHSPHAFVAYYLGQALACLVVLPMARQRARLKEASPVLDGAAAVVMFLSPWMALGASQLPGSSFWWAIMSGALGGASWVWFLARWFARFSALASPVLPTALLLAFALFPLVRIPLEFVPTVPAVGVASAIPLFQPFLLKKAHRTEESHRLDGPSIVEPLGSRGPILLAVGETCVLGLVMGLVRVSTDTAAANPLYTCLFLLLKTAIPLLLLLVLRRSHGHIGLQSICQLLFATVFICVAAGVCAGRAGQLPFALFDLARMLSYEFIYLAMAALTPRTGRTPEQVFCAGWGLYALAIGAGLASGTTLGGFEAYAEELIVCVVCGLAAVSAAVSAVSNALDAQLFPNGSDTVPAAAAQVVSIGEAVLAVANAHGLTERERECMRLICLGRSKRYIAEELGISENTVRFHVKSLYAKLGAHSRQDLVDTVGLADARPE